MQHSWIANFKAGHFKKDLNDAEARELFKSAVRMVEVEVHSYCNRRCWFCSNTLVNRRAAVRLMDPALYTSILGQLAEIGYDEMISFSRYNEPFSQAVIYDRIREARAALPKVTLHANTNGDYLKRETLRMVADSGLNSLNIQCYLRDNEQYDHEKTKARYWQIMERLGLSLRLTRDDPGGWYEGEGTHLGMKLRVYGRNFARNGNSRGETVDIARDYVRTSPCLSPFYHFYVDFNGSVMSCCNLRSEIADHRGAILGSLIGDSNIFKMFASDAALKWRRHLASYEPKAGLCRCCTFVTTDYNPDLDVAMRSLRA